MPHAQCCLSPVYLTCAGTQAQQWIRFRRRTPCMAAARRRMRGQLQRRCGADPSRGWTPGDSSRRNQSIAGSAVTGLRNAYDVLLTMEATVARSAAMKAALVGCRAAPATACSSGTAVPLCECNTGSETILYQTVCSTHQRPLGRSPRPRGGAATDLAAPGSGALVADVAGVYHGAAAPAPDGGAQLLPTAAQQRRRRQLADGRGVREALAPHTRVSRYALNQIICGMFSTACP